MTVCITKPCKVRHEAAVLELAPGEFLTVPPGKEARLIESGHARPITTQDFRDTVTDFARLDPRGDCWDFIQKHHPELWRQHIRAMRSDDLGTARRLYKQMLTAWSAAQT